MVKKSERETCMPINKKTRKDISSDIFIMQVQIWRHSRLTGGENRINNNNNNNKRRTMSRNNSSTSRINNSTYLYHCAHLFAAVASIFNAIAIRRWTMPCLSAPTCARARIYISTTNTNIKDKQLS
jgi:hypothetical protein